MTREDAIKFIEAGRAQNIPDDELVAEIKKRSVDLSGPGGLGPPPVTNAPAVGRVPAPDFAQDEANRQRDIQRSLIRGAVPMAAGLAVAPLTAGMSLPAAMAVEGAAAGTGDLAYQVGNKALTGEPVNYEESAKVGVAGAVGTGVSRTAFDILSRFAGVAPQFTRYFRNPKNFGRYNRTMMEAPKDAEFALGERIKAAVNEWNGAKTAPRLAKEGLLREATEDGVRIDANPIIAALEEAKLAAPKTPTGSKLNAELSRIQESFKSVKTLPADLSRGRLTTTKMVKPRTDLTPQEVDEFLTREIDNRIYKLSGSPKNQALAEALANARGAIRETLMQALPTQARGLTSQIYEELNKREAATKAISPSLVSLETKMRNLFKPGHQAEIEALQHVSNATGIDFIGEAFKLAQKRAFSPDERLAVKGLDAVMEIIRGSVARPAVKAIGPLQPATEQFGAAMAGGYYGGQRRQSP